MDIMVGSIRTLRGGEGSNIVDKRIGDAFWIVNEVYKNLAYLKQLSKNIAEIGSGYKGFVAITDIIPTNMGNVGTKVKTDGGYVLQSCVSSTQEVTVSILAVTGKDTFKPTVIVNNTTVPLTRNTSTDVWVGSVDLVLTG